MSVDEHQRAHDAQLELLDELPLKAAEHTQAYQKRIARAKIYKKTNLTILFAYRYYIGYRVECLIGKIPHFR